MKYGTIAVKDGSIAVKDAVLDRAELTAAQWHDAGVALAS